jgi:hypothetical protein
MTDAVTSSLEEIYRKANRQIRSTKSTFDLPKSQGLLIILNEKIDVLSPEFITYRLRKTANKKTPEKQLQFVDINWIFIVSEAHFVPVSNDTVGFPIVQLPIQSAASFNHRDFITQLSQKWSEYNKVALFSIGEIKSIKDLHAESVARFQRNTTRSAPRHEIIRRRYRRNPYLRSYDEKKLKWLFNIIMEEGTPGLLKGATKAEITRVNFWMEVFTHFMEEANYRGLDMKIFRPITEKSPEKILKK